MRTVRNRLASFDRAQIAIQPIEDFLDHRNSGCSMPGVEKDMAFVGLGRAQEAQQRQLAALQRIDEVEASVKHQNRYVCTRRKMKGVHFGDCRLIGKPSDHVYGRPEAPIHGREHRAQQTPKAITEARRQWWIVGRLLCANSA